MTAPNVNALWGQVVVDELVKSGVRTTCLAPGSRCTPLTVALSEHADVTPISHLDERSAAFFALGHAKRTGRVVPVVTTSGTAAANLHPAVIEADRGRVPMLVLTADRPPELRDSGANQTIDQVGLYGGAVRAERTLPEPAATPRTLRALRTTICRAVATATHERGPVHLNVPFRKPLAPTVETAAPTAELADRHPLAVSGRDGPFVAVSADTRQPSEDVVADLARALGAAERPLLVAGPADDLDARAVASVARAAGLPVLADPLSGVRFGPHVDDAAVHICGGYDSYLAADPPAPDLVLRVGASPTSRTLREYLGAADCRQVVVAPAGWPEAEFTATDLVRADPSALLAAVADDVDRGTTDWTDRFARLEAAYWQRVAVDDLWEGGIVADASRLAPDPSTLVVSNSMPVRDLDRYGKPRAATITALGNRGASGIDGVTSTALGAGHASDGPLVLVTGDLAFYHDMNGLVAIERADVDATIVVINNDGGGIFHILPIARHETFEPYFLTPHGLDFEHAADLYGLSFARTDDRETFRELYADAVGASGTALIEVVVDGRESHRFRDALHEAVRAELG